MHPWRARLYMTLPIVQNPLRPPPESLEKRAPCLDNTVSCEKMKRWLNILLVTIGGLLAVRVANAHDTPTSFLDLHAGVRGFDVVLTCSTTDLAHDLASIEPEMLLQPAVLEFNKNALSSTILSR